MHAPSLLTLAQMALALANLTLVFVLARRLRQLRRGTDKPARRPDPTSGFRDPCR